jgi:hypothetical protein
MTPQKETVDVRLWAVSMVRNEGDIIEAIVRHNLAFVDGMAVIDHASSDRTFDVLSALKDEGLPVVRVRTRDSAFFQGAHVSALARECFHRTGADFVFPLDADEFVHAPSRERIEAALCSLPRGAYGLQRWRSYGDRAARFPRSKA